MPTVSLNFPVEAANDFVAATGGPVSGTAQEKQDHVKTHLVDYMKNVVRSYRQSQRAVPQPTDDVAVT